ncbi:HET domain-containing protein [Candidatus Bathyarchaeota archaeon]|nr:HET domain-containing protein [Candidatus Bathyarchaeota archaeon]
MAPWDSGPFYREHILPIGSRQIRLLHIQPAASPTARLQAHLSVCSLDEPEDFEALSYVWESQKEKPQCINIEGHEMPITQSLASAFRHLRTRDSPRCVWVDAICINQQDTAEKGDQVAMMGDIYRFSTRTCIWLPDPLIPPASLNTTASLRTIFSHIASDHFHNIPGYFTDPKTGKLAFEENDEFRAAWDGFRLMADSPWWTRAWTAQEAIQPRTLRFMYGTAETCDYDTIHKAMMNEWEWKKGLQPCCTEAINLLPRERFDALMAFADQFRHINLRREAGVTRTYDGRDVFYIVLRTFSDRSCFEPRDRIYSLWSQTVDECYREHTPSYSRPLEEVFSEVFKCMLKEARNDPHRYSGMDFRVLYGFGFGPDTKRPSWVPNFLGSMSTLSVESNLRRFACIRLFRASGWKKSTLRVSGDELHLDGVCVDRVLAVGVLLREAHINTGSKAVFDQWRDMIRKTGKTITRKDLARVFCGGSYCSRLTRRQRVAQNACFFLRNAFSTHWVRLSGEIGFHMMANSEHFRQAKRDDYLRDEFDQLWEEGDFGAIGDPTYVNTIITALVDRSLFVTEGGRVGLCLPHAKAGDEVWVVYGSKMPFVLRPAGGAHSLVSDCYLQGAMYGEFVRGGTHIVIK